MVGGKKTNVCKLARWSGSLWTYEVIDNAYYIPIHEFRQTWGADQTVQGLDVDGLGLISFYDAWLDT